MQAWYYVIDVDGVVFHTNASGNSVVEVEGVLQDSSPDGLPADLDTYTYFNAVWDWDVGEIIAHPELGPRGYTVLSEEYAGNLYVEDSSGSFGLGSQPGSFQRVERLYFDTSVPPNSDYVAPFQKVYVRFHGDALIPESLVARVVVKGRALIVQTIFDYLPGAMGKTLSLVPLTDGEVEMPAFWTALQTAYEVR